MFALLIALFVSQNTYALTSLAGKDADWAHCAAREMEKVLKGSPVDGIQIVEASRDWWESSYNFKGVVNGEEFAIHSNKFEYLAIADGGGKGITCQWVGPVFFADQATILTVSDAKNTLVHEVKGSSVMKDPVYRMAPKL